MVIILNTKIAKSAQNNRFQSSSSPKAGCYIGNWRTGIYRISFNPRSRAGSDGEKAVEGVVSQIVSIHAPARGAT